MNIGTFSCKVNCVQCARDGEWKRTETNDSPFLKYGSCAKKGEINRGILDYKVTTYSAGNLEGKMGVGGDFAVLLQ